MLDETKQDKTIEVKPDENFRYRAGHVILVAAARSELLDWVEMALQTHRHGERGVHDDLAFHFDKLQYWIDPEDGGWFCEESLEETEAKRRALKE
jgi:hypothetical protein